MKILLLLAALMVLITNTARAKVTREEIIIRYTMERLNKLAQEPELPAATAETPTSTSASKFKLSGKAEFFGTGYARKRGSKENWFGETRLLPKASWTPSEEFTFIIESNFRLDSANLANGTIDRLTEKENRSIINLRQALAEQQLNDFRLRFGKQIFEWGVTDTVSPSDNLNPRDYTDFIRTIDKVGVPAISIKYGNEAFIEAVVIPWLTPSKLPTGNQRWAQDLPTGISNGQSENTSGFKPQLAIRFGINQSGFDLGASLYQGYSYSPTYKLTPISPATTELAPLYNRETVYTITIAKSLSAYNLRSEVGYFDQDKAEDFTQYVVAIDREWSGPWRETDSFYALVQYADSITTRSSTSVPGTFDLRRVLDNALMAKIKYSPEDTRLWEFGIEGSFNAAHHDWLLSPSVTRKITGNLNIKVAGDLLGGPAQSFFGSYKKNDRLTLTVTWFF